MEGIQLVMGTNKETSIAELRMTLRALISTHGNCI